MDPLFIPRKDFSTTDTNRLHPPRCVMVFVDADSDDEALLAVKYRFSELHKYPLRLPSDIFKYPEVHNFFSIEDQERDQKAIQTDSKIMGREVACQIGNDSARSPFEQSKMNEMDRSIAKGVRKRSTAKKVSSPIPTKEETNKRIDDSKVDKNYSTTKETLEDINSNLKPEQLLKCVVCKPDKKEPGWICDAMEHVQSRHCGMDQRFACILFPLCTYVSTHREEMIDHMSSEHNRYEDPMDRMNSLRIALWRSWMHKCFPNEYSVHRKDHKSMNVKCSCCSVDFPTNHLYAHIVCEHSDEDIDYNDPEGVKRRFFPDAPISMDYESESDADVEEEEVEEKIGEKSIGDDDHRTPKKIVKIG
ncbi:hypothetical protein PENTCL1PPCAC_16355 [Pristionchus entomophagus]|uniref:C2H2-type domain-containing protein n=1 Tax=Pristionchus entomophagus TaxID=358040 RepID=A0AAV5TIK2_9BILA|nr:hypothetical protein PENTCL1PPCAC_16355 [Pristionchus entomophagus]